MAAQAKLYNGSLQDRVSVTARQCSSMTMIYLVIIVTISCMPIIVCQSTSQQGDLMTRTKTDFDSNLNATSSESSTSLPPSSSSTTSSEEEYSDYSSETNFTNTGVRRKHDAKKIGQIVVYFSVIFIALAGVLIKYFITQYESSQLKAQEQLNYQRLQHRC